MKGVFVFVLLISVARAAKILCFFGAPSISHQITFQPIWKELSLRGHQVTVITTDPLKDKSLTNLREIDIHDISYYVWNKYNISTLGTREEVDSSDMTTFINAIFEIMDVQLSHPEVKEIIQNKNNDRFDLLLVENLLPASYPLKQIYNCPLVGIQSMPITFYGHEAMGNPIHPVLYTDVNFPHSRNLTFYQRVQSFFHFLMMKTITYKFRQPLLDVLQRHFTIDRATFEELYLQTSLVLTNVNPILNVPRPNVPAVIEFTGIHIKPEKPLPTDLKTYLDNAKEGVIYLSFGSNIKSNLLPENKIKIILNTFSELPYKFIWKFESEHISDKPDNVLIKKWMPQQDVLRHPNVKLFITQGGLQSLDEAMHSKTPVIVIPFFGDQFGNAKKVVHVGMGETLQFSKLTKDDFKAKILEVVTNIKFSERLEEIYNILTDQPVDALEKAVWWIEYVLRHKGAQHLRSPAIDLPSYQYYMIDIFAFFAIILSVISYILYRIIRFVIFLILRIIFKSNNCKKSKTN